MRYFLKAKWSVTGIVMTAAFTVALLWFVFHRTIPIRPTITLFDKQIMLPSGPFGELLRSVDQTHMKAKANLNPGRYDIHFGDIRLVLEIQEATVAEAGVDVQVSRTGVSKKGSWLIPEIEKCDLAFSHPVRFGYEILGAAVSSVEIRSRKDITAQVDLDFADTLGFILTRVFFGAGQSMDKSNIDLLVDSVDVESAKSSLKPATKLSIETSRLVLGDSCSAHFRDVKVACGVATGLFSAQLNLADGTQVVMSDLNISPKSAKLRLTGRFECTPAETSVMLEIPKRPVVSTEPPDAAPASLKTEGAKIKLGTTIELNVDRMTATVAEFTGKLDGQSGLGKASMKLSDGQIALGGRTIFKLGKSVIALSDPSDVKLKHVEASDEGQIQGEIDANLAIGSETALDLEGLRIHPSSGTIKLPMRFKYSMNGGLSLDLAKITTAKEGPNVTLVGVKADLPAVDEAAAKLSLGHIAVQLRKWSGVFNPDGQCNIKSVEFAAGIEQGALSMPVGDGALSITEFSSKDIEAHFPQALGADSFRVALTQGIHVGRSSWVFAQKGGIKAEVSCEGFATSPTAVTCWNDLALDMTAIALKPSRIRATDTSGKSVQMKIETGASLSAKEQFVINLATPSRSVIPTLAFHGKLSSLIVGIGGVSIGLTDADVDADFTVSSSGVLTFSGSPKGHLLAENLPEVNDLIRKGRLQLDDLTVTARGSSIHASIGHIRIRVPRKELADFVREKISRQWSLPDTELVGTIVHATATEITVEGIDLPSITFGHDRVEAEVSARAGTQVTTNVLLGAYFSAEATAHIVGDVSVVGGTSLLEKRIRIDTECDKASVHDLHYGWVPDWIVEAAAALFSGVIKSNLKQQLTFSGDWPIPFGDIPREVREWLDRIYVKESSFDIDEDDLILSISAELR